MFDSIVKAAGLLAAAVAGAYVLGGLVIALRLLLDGFSLAVVIALLGQLPRELVVTTALLEVLGPALFVGVVVGLVAGLVVYQVGGDTPEEASGRWRWALRVGAPTTAAVSIGIVVVGSTALGFEEAQVCTTDGEAPATGLLIGEGGDNVLLATDFDDEESVLSLPTDRVTKSEYGDLSTEFPCAAPPAAQAAEVAAALAALGAHGGERELELAMELRPRLRFDSEERWRPLEVEGFVAEGFEGGEGHGACAPGARPGRCPDVAGLDDLHGRGVAYLDIHGGARNGRDVVAPPSDCAKPPPAVDCGEGEASVVYYRRTSHGNRWYWDYWWFFRYNDYTGDFNKCKPFYCGDHEGDWEGVTVVTTAAAEPEVLGAIYATHKERVLVDASVLPLAGRHPRVFVADGTHASYPFSCASRCAQYSTVGFLGLERNLFEETHDGAVRWAHNRDESCEEARCVRPLPEGAGREEGASLPFAGQWAAWGGRWGATCHDGCPEILPHRESSPRSPGRQLRFQCPWVPTLEASPRVGQEGLLETRPVGDRKRQLAACAARRGGL